MRRKAAAGFGSPLLALFLAATLSTTVLAQRDVHIGFLGDGGSGGSSQKKVRDQLVRAAGQNKLDWIFLLGDNIYEKGERKHIQGKFLDIYQELLDGPVQLHSALGNHDVKKCDKKRFDPRHRDGNAYPGCADVQAQLSPSNRFGYPEGQRYYSIVSEGSPPLVEVFLLDANTLPIKEYVKSGRPADQAQLQWLDEELGQSEAVWKIVAFHNAMHSPDRDRWFSSRGSELALRATLEPILQKHRVDVVFQGHQHFYARMVPQQGIRYFVAGGGGQGVYKHRESPGYAVDSDGSRGKFNHFVHVRITDEVFQYCTVDDNGVVRDVGWFRKGDDQDTEPADGKCPF